MNRYRNNCEKTIGMFLIIYIGFIAIINIIIPDKKFSESENRVLEQVPNFSIQKLFEGRYTSDYEKYISDQFPLRDFWIGVKSSCERIAGKKENNDIYIGKDGYLLEKFNNPNDNDFKQIIQGINSFVKNNSSVNKYLMLVPNSVKILEDKLPFCAPVDDELILMNKVKKYLNKNITFVNVYDTLYSKKNEYIYYKTDHHWTTKGAFYAYEKLGKNMGFIPHSKDYFNIRKVTNDFYGSLYSKGGFRNIEPDSIELYIPKANEEYEVEYSDKNDKKISLYNEDSLNKKDKYTVFLGGNHPLVKINSKVKSGKKLLIIKDSYANSFVPFLIGHFSEIYMVDLRYFDDNLNDFIKNKDIDDVLFLYNVKSFFENNLIKILDK